MFVSMLEGRREIEPQASAADREKLLEAVQEMAKHIAAAPANSNGIRSIAARVWAERIARPGLGATK